MSTYEEKIEALANYYSLLNFPLYNKEAIMDMSDEELDALYDITFPND